LLNEQKQLPTIIITNNQGNVYLGPTQIAHEQETKLLTDNKELITQLQTQYTELAEKHSQLITKQLIGKLEEITEDSGKIFSAAEKPILEKKIGQGGYGEIYLGQ